MGKLSGKRHGDGYRVKRAQRTMDAWLAGAELEANGKIICERSNKGVHAFSRTRSLPDGERTKWLLDFTPIAGAAKRNMRYEFSSSLPPEQQDEEWREAA